MKTEKEKWDDLLDEIKNMSIQEYEEQYEKLFESDTFEICYVENNLVLYFHDSENIFVLCHKNNNKFCFYNIFALYNEKYSLFNSESFDETIRWATAHGNKLIKTRFESLLNNL